ncbi:MAG: putative metal-binding motif-containing protein [Bacteroidia bacterium]
MQLIFSVSGGVAPYTVCWDTLNTITGNQMAVMVAGKTPSNPYSALGNLSCYYINGEEMPSLNLVRGITYSFNVLSPGHPFHISTDSVGGSTTGLVSNGQAGAPNDNGTVTFTPNNAHPSLLRYDCSNHQYMGYRVNIVNGYCTEDLSSLKAGTYNVIVHDANGCEASASFTIIEEGDAPLLSSEADASCFNAADGSVELIPSSASGPYTISGTGPVFSVIAEVKNHSHPQFGLGGRPDGFTIDGVQGKELTLVRGITYSFSVLAPTHSFFISTSDAGGPANLGSVVTQGVVNNFVSNGTLLFTPDASHPALLYYQCGNHDYMGWKLNIVDGINNLSVSGLVAGDYTFSITDGTGCTSAPLPVTVHEPAGTVLYYDADGDMYGTNSETTIACSPFGSFVPDGNDCDDQNTAFNPGVTEICNGVDDDCDGLIDDLDPSLSGIISYSDIDTDGFGDPATQVITCTLPSGNVLNGLDCDDNNASVNPLAHETCNGIDDDCNGIIDDGAGCFVDIHVKCFIQGYFDGVSAMRAVADPLGSPSVCDTLRLDLADSDNPSTILFTATSTVSTSGQAIFRFPSSIDGTKFYFIFRHRSALETWSGESLTATDQAFFDFTADPVLTFGNNVIELTPGIFGFWNGDVNQDGVIDNSDLQSVETDLPLFTRGYLPQDLDGNLCIESADYSLIENNSVLGISVAHP